MKRFCFDLMIFASSWHVLIGNAQCRAADDYKIVCYVGSWQHYRSGDRRFSIEDIDPTLCTHLVYAFASLGNDSKISSRDPNLDLKEYSGLGAYERFTGLKQHNPGLKTLLSIRGWSDGSIKYSNMVKDAANRATFVESVVQYLNRFNFDGLDLDWEYPTKRGGIPEDKENFVELIKELKEAFGPRGLMLTAAVAKPRVAGSVYDIPVLGEYLDLINLMTYNFHGGWESKTGHCSPLYPRPDESGYEETLNVDYTVKYWLSRGAPAHKLILGMPLYGRTFRLQSAENYGLDAPVVVTGPNETRPRDDLGYNEICPLLASEDVWNVTRDPYIQAPYAVRDRLWVAYEDVQSISRKVDYIVEMGLGGGMVWSMGTDDFRGTCHGIRYPLLRAINSGLNRTLAPDIDQDNSTEIICILDAV